MSERTEFLREQTLSRIDQAFELYKTPGLVKGKILIDSEA